MKAKSLLPRGGKPANPEKKGRPTVAGKNGNGHGNGEHPNDLNGGSRISALGHKEIANPPPLDKKTLLAALVAFKKGDFSARLPLDLEGMDGKIADAFNEVIEQNERMSRELERLSRVVGKEGKISQRATIGEVTGAWQGSVDSVDALIGDLVHPTSETAR